MDNQNKESSGSEIIKNKSVLQFVKFAVVGGGATVVDYLVFFLFSRILITGLFSGQVLKQVSKSLSFIVSAAVNYYFNRKWTFQSHDKNVTTQTLKFYVVAGVGLIFNNLIFYVITTTSFFGWVSSDEKVWAIFTYSPVDIWGLLSATGIVLFWNFFMNRAWTFKK